MGRAWSELLTSDRLDSTDWSGVEYAFGAGEVVQKVEA